MEAIVYGLEGFFVALTIIGGIIALAMIFRWIDDDSRPLIRMFIVAAILFIVGASGCSTTSFYTQEECYTEE